jgi:hypothetical protein
MSMAFAGCAAYKPIPEGYKGDLAKVADTYQYVSSTKVYLFQLSEVDNRDVLTSSISTYERNYGQGFSMRIAMEEREVPAAESVLHIEGITYVAAPVLSLFGGMYSVSGEVTVNLEAGKEYFVKGELSELYSAVWLEDGDGNMVSEKIEKKSK